MRQWHNPIRQLLLAGVTLWPATATAQDDPYAFFEAQVRPVLVEHCYPCHSTAQEHPKGAFRLDTRDGLLKGGASGIPGIVAGNAAGSRIVEALRYANHELQMPPKDKLPEDQIDAIVAWINSGAPDPRIETVAKPAPPSRDHWAFKAPVASPLPAVADTAWPRSDIDAFVLAKLEEQGLRPAPQAERRTLIRRAYFALLGLPPAVEAVDAFVKDPDPDAFAKLVDELLASPHYGERWARHWLDVARYADTKGYVYPEREEARFFHSHVYRDWVTRALNDDMPYDQFVRYQIAGDQIAGPNGEDERAAMGFLTLGRRFLGVVHDIIDDRIDVVMRGTQGLTMTCARCHDHKFDPLSARDYYGLYGVFSGSSERTVALPGVAEEAKEAAAFQAEWNKREQALNAEFMHRKQVLASRLRDQVAAYLAAVPHASTFPSDEFYEIRGPDDLNPTIVWQWRRYIDRQPLEDPLWGPWRQFERLPAATFAADAVALARTLDSARFNVLIVAALRLAPPASMDEVAAIYGRAFARVVTAWYAEIQRCVENDLPDPVRLDDAGVGAAPAGAFCAGQPGACAEGARWWMLSGISTSPRASCSRSSASRWRPCC
jgi:hypothetical protein